MLSACMHDCAHRGAEWPAWPGQVGAGLIEPQGEGMHNQRPHWALSDLVPNALVRLEQALYQQGSETSIVQDELVVQHAAEHAAESCGTPQCRRIRACCLQDSEKVG